MVNADQVVSSPSNVVPNPSDATTNDLRIHIPTANRFLKELIVPIVMRSCISIFGTLSNLLFILCLFKDIRLKTMSIYLICYLAFVDMLICCLVIPWSLTVKAGSASSVSCYLEAIRIFFFAHLSMQAQYLISCNRYFLITKARLVYNMWFSSKRCALYIAVGWAFAITMIVTQACLVEGPVDVITENCNTISDVTRTRRTHQLILVRRSVIYFAMTFTFYGMLIKFVRRNLLSLHLTNIRETKLSETLFSLLVVFAVCCLVSLYVTSEKKKDSTNGIMNVVEQCRVSLLQMNYCINTIVHGYRVKHFKDALKGMCFPCCANRIVPISAPISPLTSYPLECTR